MPVVVDEVVISVTVTNQDSGGAASAPPAAVERQSLVQECVERVLEILHEREER